MYMNTFQWDERPPAFEVADGEHKVEILKAYDGTTQGGKSYTAFLLKVEGANVNYTHSIYYGNEYTNRNWTSVLAAFRITPPPTDRDWADFYDLWQGLEGRAVFRHKDDTYTGRDGVERTVNKCELHYLVTPPRQQGTVTAPSPAKGAQKAQRAQGAKAALPPQYGAAPAPQQGPGGEDFPEDPVF